jgi:hypothetical protein
MKGVRLIGFLAVLISCFALPTPSQDSTHNQWVAESLKAIESVKIGMTRSELEKVFTADVGLSTPQNGTFVYRDCRYFKVDAAFNTKAGNQAKGADKIVYISKPYLDWPHAG